MNIYLLFTKSYILHGCNPFTENAEDGNFVFHVDSLAQWYDRRVHRMEMQATKYMNSQSPLLVCKSVCEIN